MTLRNIFRRRRDSKSSSDDSRAARNSLDPPASATYSSRLPDDIIYELFQVAALVYPPRALVMMPASAQALAHTDTLLGWVILTHLCRRWRSIGLSATLAPLWARIVCLSWKPSVAVELSQRAQGCPITIDLTRYNGDFSGGITILRPLEDWAYVNIGRAGTLISPGMTLLDKLNSQRLVLPNLREIHLGADLPWHFSPRWELPGLRSAWLNMTLLPHSLVVTLRELHLRMNATRIPLAILRDFLRACPYLEVLDISVTGEWSHEDALDDTRPEILRRASRAALKEPSRSSISSERTLSSVRTRPRWTFGVRYMAPPELSLRQVYPSGALPRVRDPLYACKREMDSVLYDRLEVGMPEGHAGRGELRLCLSSSSTNASCELLFPTDDDMRTTIFSLLSSYIPTAAPHITTLTLDALVADAVHIDDTFCALGRDLTGVTTLHLRNMESWSAASHVRILRHAKLLPAFPALQTIRVSDIDRLAKASNGPSL